MNTPDWKTDAQTILHQTLLAIDEFATTHPSDVCLFLALGVNYYEGWVSINFDTQSNSIKKARRRVSRIRQSQKALLQHKEGWRDARYDLTRERMSGVNIEIGDFQYYLYKELTFHHWVDFFAALSEDVDQSGQVLVLLIEVVHGLSRENAFGHLSISSPFYIGVQFVDDDLGMLIMDIINWPE